MSNPAEPDPADPMPKRATIVIWLAVTIVLLGAVMALLSYRSLTVHEPQGAVVIAGNEAWADAQAVLIPQSSAQGFETKLDATGRYSATFFVAPGRYTLQIRRHGKTLYEQSIDLAKNKPETVVLPATQPTTNPAS